MYWDTFLPFFSILLFVLFLPSLPPPKKKQIQERVDTWPPLAHMFLIIFKSVAVIQVYYQYNILQRDILISLLHYVHIDYEVTSDTKWQAAADEMPTL